MGDDDRESVVVKLRLKFFSGIHEKETVKVVVVSYGTVWQLSDLFVETLIFWKIKDLSRSGSKMIFVVDPLLPM